MISPFLVDCQRRNKGVYPGWRDAFALTFRDHGLQALVGYRLGRHLLSLQQSKSRFWLRCIGWPVYYLLRTYARVVLDIRLELSADIGGGLYIGHFGNVRVENCKVGEHCSIAQSTQLAANESGSGPEIGSRVWFGAHAQVIGPYRIGDGATVSAGAVLRRDVPARALCLGNPARIIMTDYDNSEILVAAPVKIERKAAR